MRGSGFLNTFQGRRGDRLQNIAIIAIDVISVRTVILLITVTFVITAMFVIIAISVLSFIDCLMELYMLHLWPSVSSEVFKTLEHAR
eukprot:2424869-Amphidinium_carterae.1